MLMRKRVQWWTDFSLKAYYSLLKHDKSSMSIYTSVQVSFFKLIQLTILKLSSCVNAVSGCKLEAGVDPHDSSTGSFKYVKIH